MLRSLWLVVLLAQVAAAQPLEVVRADPDFRMPNRVLFVVDTSCSMDGRINEAVGAVGLILGSDEMHVGLITFGDTAERWKSPEGPWAPIPWHLREFLTFVESRTARGGTEIEAALKAAYADKRDDYVIVLVTDGDFNHIVVAGLIGVLRKQKNIRILIWGVGPDGKKMAALAKSCGGGLWIHSKRSGPW